MYDTYVNASQQGDLQLVDRALMRLRHFVEVPAAVDDAGRRIEASTLLVLEALAAMADPTVRDVARALDVTHSTASRLVLRAEQAGMVRRGPSPASHRERVVEATEEGLVVRRRAVRFRLSRLADITAGWDVEELASFARALDRFAAVAAEGAGVEPAGHQPGYGARLGASAMPNLRSARRAAYQPPSPCTPGPGGTDDEHR